MYSLSEFLNEDVLGIENDLNRQMNHGELYVIVCEVSVPEQTDLSSV